MSLLLYLVLLQDMPAAPVDDVPRYLAPSVALFEATDDELLPLKPVGIQVQFGDATNGSCSWVSWHRYRLCCYKPPPFLC